MNKIKYFRELKKLSLYDLAEKINLSPSYIGNLERGKKENPTKEVMDKIADALERNVVEIFYPTTE